MMRVIGYGADSGGWIGLAYYRRVIGVAEKPSKGMWEK